MATRPHRGSVSPSTFAAEAAAAAAGATTLQRARNQYRNGLWRPNAGFTSRDGVRITMRREPGVTKGDVLLVPMRFQLPVMGDFNRPQTYNWATFDTLRAGQKTRPQGAQLEQWAINSMLLDGVSQDTTSGAVIWPHAPHPQRVLYELRWIMGKIAGSQPEVFRLTIAQPAVWGGTPLVNALATIISIEPIQKAGEVGTEYLNITFQEFPEDEEVARKQRPQAHGASRWALRAGDTLYEIAKKSAWHQPSAWKTIAKANGIAGVSPSSAAELAAWAKKHHKTVITIPAKGRS